MHSSSVPGGADGSARDDTLADLLIAGPLPLSKALEYATQIASELRKLHGAHKAHGRVSAVTIVTGPSGARLLPARTYFDRPKQEDDVRGWGAVFYEMLTGEKAPGASPFGVPKHESPGSGPSAIRPAAMQLALKCLVRSDHVLPTMQQLLSEIRVLALLGRQYALDPEIAVAPRRPDPAPFVMRPALPEEPEWIDPEIKVHHPAGEPFDDERDAAPDDALKRFGTPSRRTRAPAAPAGSAPCPKCGCMDAFVSKPRSRLEHILAKLRKPVCRCHRCYHRWVVIFGVALPKPKPKPKPSKKPKKDSN